MSDEQTDTEVVENIDAHTGEVVPYTPPAAPSSWTPRRTGRELAMMNRDTDSWTVVVRDVGYLAAQIADTTMVPKALRGDPAAVTAVILHGRELGLAPMTSLALTHVVEGKVAVTAEGMRGLIMDDGHELKFIESDSSRCTLAGRRKGSETWTQVTWTIADAQRAGVAGKQVWKAYGRRMLQARATSELAQMMFPDVIHGLRTTEELEDMSDLADAPSAPAPAPAPAPTRVKRQPPPVRAIEAPSEETSTAAPVEAPAPRVAPPRTRGTKTAAGDGGGATSPAAQTPEAEPTPKGSEDGDTSGHVDTPTPPVDVPAPDQQEPEGWEPEPLPEEDAPAPAPLFATPKQRGFVMAECNRFGLTDRTERLAYLQTIADRDAPLLSTNDLTRDEAALILDRMTACKDRDELDARVMNR